MSVGYIGVTVISLDLYICRSLLYSIVFIVDNIDIAFIRVLYNIII